MASVFSESRNCEPTTWLVRFPESIVIFPTWLQFHCEFWSIVLSRRAILFVFFFYFYFNEARCDQFLQDLIFLLLIAFALIAIDIALNRWRGLRAATRSTDLLIETENFPTVLQCTVKFWSIAWKWM